MRKFNCNNRQMLNICGMASFRHGEGYRASGTAKISRFLSNLQAKCVQQQQQPVRYASVSSNAIRQNVDLSSTISSSRLEKVQTAAAPRTTVNDATTRTGQVLDLNFLLSAADKTVDGGGGIPHWVRTPVDMQMYKANNLDDLLNVVEKFRLNGLQAAAFCVQLARFAPFDVEKLTSDARFIVCTRTLIDEVWSLPFNYLLVAFRSLLFAGVKGKTEIRTKLQADIERRINDNKISILALTTFACFHVDYVSDSNDEPEMTRFQQLMENRIFEQLSQISDPHHLLLILNKLCRDRKKSQERMTAVEDRATYLLDFMTADDLVNLLTYVSTARSRNVNLLKSVAGKLVACSGQLPPKRIHAVLTSLNKLSYFPPAFLQRIFLDLTPQAFQYFPVEKLKPVEFNQICTQLGLSRLRHVDTMYAMTDWLTSNYDSCKPSDFVAFVLMLARCNFSSEATVRLCDRIRSDLKIEAVKDKLLWLDYVWAMAILNNLSIEMASSVLNADFYKYLIDDSDDYYRSSVAKLKLLNINAAVEVDLKEKSQLSLNSSSKDFSLIKNLQIIRRKQKEKFLDQFLESLNVLAPKDSYTKCAYITSEGYAIDAEIYVDENAKAIPVKDWPRSTNAGSENESCVNITFLLFDYMDNTLLSRSLTGLNAMAIRHLKAKGRSVAKIHTYELKKRHNVLERVSYLKSLIERMNSEKRQGL